MRELVVTSYSYMVITFKNLSRGVLSFRQPTLDVIEERKRICDFINAACNFV